MFNKVLQTGVLAFHVGVHSFRKYFEEFYREQLRRAEWCRKLDHLKNSYIIRKPDCYVP